MKDKQIQILAAVSALGAVYLFMRTSQVKAGAQPGAGPAREVTPPNSNGWRYFSDGVAIDPMGNYYKHGQMVYTAPYLGEDGAFVGPPV